MKAYDNADEWLKEFRALLDCRNAFMNDFALSNSYHDRKFRYKKQYVPVWFPDNTDFIVQLLVTDAHTPGGTLSQWITGGVLEIYINDSMYSDDVTTGSP